MKIVDALRKLDQITSLRPVARGLLDYDAVRSDGVLYLTTRNIKSDGLDIESVRNFWVSRGIDIGERFAAERSLCLLSALYAASSGKTLLTVSGLHPGLVETVRTDLISLNPEAEVVVDSDPRQAYDCAVIAAICCDPGMLMAWGDGWPNRGVIIDRIGREKKWKEVVEKRLPNVSKMPVAEILFADTRFDLWAWAL